MSYLTDDPIDTKALVSRLLRASDGALVVFEGVVRDHSEGKPVESIFYDAYRPMAEKEIGTIVENVKREWPDVAVDCLHRLGHLVVGETSIAIVAVSPHRAEAFAAGQYAIDRLKQVVPIWKKEVWSDGSQWIGWENEAHAAH
jgi:molybdopterin synthase catalytic subunit